MQGADKPYAWGHPQFDRENWVAWAKFREENPYVSESGKVFTLPQQAEERSGRS